MTRVQALETQYKKGLESLQSIEEVSRDTIKIYDLHSLQSKEEMFITNPLEKKPSNFE